MFFDVVLMFYLLPKPLQSTRGIDPVSDTIGSFRLTLERQSIFSGQKLSSELMQNLKIILVFIVYKNLTSSPIPGKGS